ncbi:MAG: hypothetical protein ABI954_03665 [Pyrinomonadaceae bacterium]
MENFTAVSFNQNLSHRSLDTSHDNSDPRLVSLLASVDKNKLKQKLFRRESHEFEAGLMLRPFTPQDAYGQFGLLLGVIPPAAIFYQFLVVGLHVSEISSGLFFVMLFFLMNVVCAFVGRGMGRSLAKTTMDLERCSWTVMLLTIPFIGLLWGMVTGFVGGLLFFGFGAIGGFLIAAPIGAVAFTLFAISHRLLERGTFIERQHFLPIAYGISLTLAAFVLGL